jgi:hypothetical protein
MAAIPARRTGSAWLGAGGLSAGMDGGDSGAAHGLGVARRGGLERGRTGLDPSNVIDFAQYIVEIR